MFASYNLFFIVLCYLLLLFAVAYYAEKKEKAGKSIVNNPYIYSLSLAVYCTSWTFYGSVGKAATSGLSFLTTYLGPTLMAAVWLVVLKKVVRIAKANRITTISDFMGSRYGKSLSLSTLVTIVAVVGIAPYLGLQIKAIISTFTIISGEVKGSAAAGLFITMILGIFAIMFGARRLDSSERHGGLVFAIAFESIVKLIAFVLVGIFVTYGLFEGFSDIFDRIKDSEHSVLLFLGTGTETAYFEWFALLFLSMMAIMFLPRQFQMAVVENYDEAHITKAAWLFPLYLFLINIFVLPIAFGGLLLGGAGKDADYFVLTLPLSYGKQYLSLLAFIGGFSAATGMVIVEALALSTMVMNSIIMPTLINFHDAPKFPAIVLNIKRLVILGVVFLGYFFATSIGEFYSLVDMGLKSFEAVTLFAPAFLLGLYWKRGTKMGAIAGLIAGFTVWFYTLIMPALIKAGIVKDIGLIGLMTGSEMLNPASLFGINWNKEMETITGIKKSEAFNSSIILLLPWIPGDALLQNEQNEITFQTPTHQTFKINISPFKDPSGYPAGYLAGGYVVILEDITEKKKMEEQLFQASKLASIGKLTAGISHEIGNPLASISSLVQELGVLKPESNDDAEFTENSLKTINSHIERIARIVRSLGDFARISSVEKTVSSIPEILDRTINLVKYDKRFKDIHLDTEIGDIPRLVVNPDQIQQVFLNLMLNALDAMPEGGRLYIKMERAGNFIEIIFHDTGVGIEESVMDKIFDPFFTTKPFGKGTGLGLSICYGIIREHNGTITVKSKKGEGTTFVIKLPIENGR
ncbi:MAG: ATP-binding protein [Nitrospirota bacterium]